MLLPSTVFTVTGVGDSPSDPSTATSGDLRYCVLQADNNTSNPDGSLIGSTRTSSTCRRQSRCWGVDWSWGNPAAPTTIAGPAGATISGAVEPSSNFSVFTVPPNVTTNLSGLTIANGYTSGDGGGIQNYGTLTLTEATLSGNVAYDGGAMENFGKATLILYATSAIRRPMAAASPTTHR